MRSLLVLSMLAAVVCASCTQLPEASQVTNPHAKWPGFVPKDDPWYFPIMVFTQEPKNATKYKELGINLYFALWQGPTAEQLAEFKKHDMRVICEFNEYAQGHLLADPTVVAWVHIDEPDLAVFSRGELLADQARAKKLVKEHWPEMYKEMDLDNKDYNGWGFGHGPEVCRQHYERVKSFDKNRPVVMMLSQAVAERFIGRGDRTDHDEDYPKYINGATDIVAFDIYPVAYGRPDDLWLVPKGIDKLNQWDNGSRPKWCAIECTFGRPDKAIATAEQIRAQIWMAIIHGARGFGYFVHNFDKDGKYVTDKGLLEDPAMMKAVTAQNAEIRSLAKVIYAPGIEGVSLATHPEAKLDYVARRVDGSVYILSSTMTTTATSATFVIAGAGNGEVEVINENRTLKLIDGKFTDAFAGFDVNLYRIRK